MNLLSGHCELCNQQVVHRHKRTTYVAATDGDSIFICRECDDKLECDDCGSESALYLYEQKHGGSADKLAPEAMVTAIFAIEFAEWFLANSPEYLSLRKAYDAAYRQSPLPAMREALQALYKVNTQRTNSATNADLCAAIKQAEEALRLAKEVKS